MFNKKSPLYENHFLNAIDSVEVNLRSWREFRAFSPVNCQGISLQNAWLKCGASIDSVLEKGELQSKTFKAEKLNRSRLLTKQRQSLVEQFQAVSNMLEEQADGTQKQAALKEYQQLAGHILPTLARINQRAEARRTTVGIPVMPKKLPAEDENLAVALRAVLKRRG